MAQRRIWKLGFENLWRKPFDDYCGGVEMAKRGTAISDAENDKGVLGDGMEEALGYETVDEAFLLKSRMKER